MSPPTLPPDERAPARELELTPVPRIQRLSSAIVWIAAILAVAVLWIVGYLVTSKAERRAAERKPAATAPTTPVEDLAERIRRAALREAAAAAERAEAARPPRELPPGFETLFGDPGLQSADGGPFAGGPGGWQPAEHPAPPPQPTSLERARGSGLLPDGFRSAAPRATSEAPTDPAADGAFAGFADFRNQLAGVLQAAHGGQLPPQAGQGGPQPGPAGSGGGGPRVAVLSREARAADLVEPGSPLVLHAGTLIPAVLTAGIHSDLPGPTTALVRRHVWDTLTGRHLLVPQGSRLVGEYESRVAIGQKRVLVAWQLLIFPDGRTLDLRGMPGADLAGAAGFHDRVDNHFVRTFGGAVLLAAISAGVQLSQPSDDGDFRNGPTPSQVAAAAVGQELGRVATETVRRAIDLRPTLEVRPGYPFQVEVTADLVFDRPYPEPVGLW